MPAEIRSCVYIKLRFQKAYVSSRKEPVTARTKAKRGGEADVNATDHIFLASFCPVVS